MPTIKIASWSIENYGPLRSGLMYGNMDIVQGIASTIVDLNVDIFVLLDVSSTKDGTSNQVSGTMAAALQAASVAKGKTGEFATWVLSANIGSEYYAYFVRDTSLTVPIPVTGTTEKPTVAPKILGADGASVTDAIFTESSASGELPSAFPLLSPDVAMVGSDGVEAGIPKWTGDRRPVLGLFSIPGAQSANQILPLVACRFATSEATAVGQVRTLPNISLLKNLGPNPAPPATALVPVSLQIVPLGSAAVSAKPTAYFILAGNFNIDFKVSPEFFAPLTTALGATAGIDANTFLITINDFDPGIYKTTESLAIRAYDNIFTRASATAASPVTGQNPKKLDVPALLANRTIALSSSVRYYALLDTVGVPAPDVYSCLMSAFGRQLAAVPPADLGVENALIGARLISDHLPIYLELVID